jgi:hypothetical protein
MGGRDSRLPLTTFVGRSHILAFLGTLIVSLGCTEASASSPRTALVAPIELSNNAQLRTKFTVRIDGEFWIEIKYPRNFHFSADHPAPLTEFSAQYIIKQHGKIVQRGDITPWSNVPAGMSGGHYAAVLGRFVARKYVEYEIALKLGADVPDGLPKSATVAIYLDPRVPYSFLRGW